MSVWIWKSIFILGEFIIIHSPNLLRSPPPVDSLVTASRVCLSACFLCHIFLFVFVSDCPFSKVVFLILSNCVCLSVCLSLDISFFHSHFLFSCLCQSLCLSFFCLCIFCLSVCKSIHLFISPSFCLFYLYLFACKPVCLSHIFTTDVFVFLCLFFLLCVCVCAIIHMLCLSYHHLIYS